VVVVMGWGSAWWPVRYADCVIERLAEQRRLVTALDFIGRPNMFTATPLPRAEGTSVVPIRTFCASIHP
jgi:hypothetical protein